MDIIHFKDEMDEAVKLDRYNDMSYCHALYIVGHVGCLPVWAPTDPW